MIKIKYQNFTTATLINQASDHKRIYEDVPLARDDPQIPLTLCEESLDQSKLEIESRFDDALHERKEPAARFG